MTGRLRITQTRSGIGGTPRQRRTLSALGLHHPRDTVEQADRPSVRGMLARVSHLVEWEPVGEDRDGEAPDTTVRQ